MKQCHNQIDSLMPDDRQRICKTALLLIAFCLGCRPSVTTAISEQSFGQRQLHQVLQDRPDMQGVVSVDSKLAQWIAKRFEGQGTGTRVHWHEREPLSGSEAEHLPAYEGYPANLSITKSESTSPIDKWASLVYELLNLEESVKSNLFERALEGEFDADEFATECVRSEYRAVLATRDLFLKYPIAGANPSLDPWYCWATSRLLPVDEYFDDAEENGTLNQETNYRYFRDYFLEDFAPYLADQQQFRVD